MNRPTRSKLSERRREVANFALKGWTQAAIARQMHVPQATVSRDLAAMREFWRECLVYQSMGTRKKSVPAAKERAGTLTSTCSCAKRPILRNARFCGRIRRIPALHQSFRQFSNGWSGRAVFGVPGECGDSSAGPGWGTGEDTSPPVNSSSVEKLRKSAMSAR